MRLAVALVGLGACADASFRGDGSWSGLDSGDGATSTSDSAAPPAPPVPTWYHLDATVVLDGGAPAADRTTVTATLHDETGAALCAHTLPVTAIATVPRPTGERDLLAWWKVDLGEGVSDVPCEAFPPRSLWWGVGPYDPALDPARVSAGLGDATANAAVLREDEDGPSWLVGLFGTDDQLAGYAPAGAVRPLSDGSYRWVGLILLSWPPPAG